MFRSLATLVILFCVLVTFSLFASCQSVDIEIGWRRDNLDWKLDHLQSPYVPAIVDDHILFKDIHCYTISGQAKWVGSEYYIRLSAEYGLTDKGRADELFNIRSPLFFFPITVEANSPIKRRSEMYDFDAAVGYPFAFLNCRLFIIPLIGFSFHRQRLRVKEHEEPSSFSSYYYDYPLSSSEFFLEHSSSSFYVSSVNPFIFQPISNPFSSPPDPNIANVLGLSNPHRTSTYRFTWYGFYLGADISFALDSDWTLFWDTEFHFLNNCHRKRKSWTGVYFVDEYHKKGYAYGFNNVVGLTYYMCSCWYTILSVDFNYWKSHSSHDDLQWNKVGAKIGLAYSF